jgi:hypothetical protein
LKCENVALTGETTLPKGLSPISGDVSRAIPSFSFCSIYSGPCGWPYVANHLGCFFCAGQHAEPKAKGNMKTLREIEV